MAYNKQYGISQATGHHNVLSLLEDEPIHPMAFGYDAASGKDKVVFHPAGLGYPAAGSPTRTKAGVGDDTAPVPATNGLELNQYAQARVFLIFEDAGNNVVTDGEADVTIWHRGLPGVEDAGATPGPWVSSQTVAEVTNNEEVLDTMLYHREIYIQLTNLAGTALDHVDIYVAGIEHAKPFYPFRFSSSGALLVEIKDVHVEVGNIEVQLEASPDQVGEKADSVLISSTLDHTNIVSGNYQPPVAPLYIDWEGRLVPSGFATDGEVTWDDGPIRVGGRDYQGAYSTLTTALGGADNDLTYTAKRPGVYGDTISVEYVDGGGGATTTVSVTGPAITVSADIGAGVTSFEVIQAIRASYEAHALVAVENATGNDGTGNIAVMGAANLAGGANGDHVYSRRVASDGSALTSSYNDTAATDIADRIEEVSTAAGSYGYQTGGTVTDGLPTALADGQFSATTYTKGRLLRQTDIAALYHVLGQSGIYSAPVDFTATYASATTVTLAGLPFTPTDNQFVGAIEITNTGEHLYYTPADGYLFTYNSGTAVLTVDTAAFAATSSVVPIIAGQQKGYDAVLNAFQTVVLNALQWDWIDSQTVVSAHDLSAASPADSGWVSVKGLTHVRVFYDWTSGTGAAVHNLLVDMYGNDTDAGTTEYLDKDSSLGSSVSGASTDHDYSELVYVGGYDRVKIYTDESGGTGKGTVTLSVTMIND